MRKASVKASETPNERLHRKQSNKDAMANKRNKSVSVKYAIAAFHSEVCVYMLSSYDVQEKCYST